MKLPWYNRQQTSLAVLTAKSTLLPLLLAFTSPASGVERQALRGHVPSAISRLGLNSVGRLPATNRLSLAVGLPLRHTNDLSRVLRELYDPASPQFRHYLTPEQFTERFGPTSEDYKAVADFARRHGLEVRATHGNRVVLDVAGQAADVEKAFGVKLHRYRHPTEAREFYAPDVEPTVDADVPVLDISGLNNYSIPHPVYRVSPLRNGAQPGSGSGPGGSYRGRDFRNAYVPGVPLTGSGQKVGLVEFDTYYTNDITTYESLAGLPRVPIQHILLDGFNGVPVPGSPGIFEVSLDIELVVAMAPGLDGVVVFDAGEGGLWNDMLSAMAARPDIKQLSSSWGSNFEIPTAFPFATYDQLLQQLALQGQSFFQASGDTDSWSSWQSIPWWPGDAPYVTSVGGTLLAMNGSGASYASESVWNLGYGPPGWGGTGYAGSTGGTSGRYPIPTWQLGLDMSASGGSAAMRNFPDVSMVAGNIFVVADNGSYYNQSWGTSCAAPLWAAFTALVNQAATANGQPPVGFLNPALYELGKSSRYTNCFHDIRAGNDATEFTPNRFPAVPGYDLCTGWGTPNGSNLIYALAFPEPLRVSPPSVQLISGPVGGPFSPSTLGYSLTNLTGSIHWAVGQDANWLAVSATGGALTGGGPATDVSVTPTVLASNLTAGSYTATLLFTNLDDQVVQTRQATLAIVTPPVITLQPSNQVLLEGLSASFSVGTAPNALLSYQWQFDTGGGPTNLADGGGISGAATSSLTISDVSPANVGAYSVIVSNAAGSLASGAATLTVLIGQPPAIISQPSDQTSPPGAPVSFTVAAAGDSPLSFSWQMNGTTLADGGGISGSSSNTLHLATTSAASVGTYSVVITNVFGSITSSPAVLRLASVTPDGVKLETLYSFTTNGNGINPYGGVIQASDGSFYGTAQGGGQLGWGTVFLMTANGAVSLVHAFTDGTDGGWPWAGVIQGTNGLLYGTTQNGTVFRVTTNGATTGYSLSFDSSGSFPMAGLVQGADGNFYGTAVQGGAYTYRNPFGYGTVFKLTPAGVLAGVASFNFEAGAGPASTLIQGPDLSFYGTASAGGTNGGWGTIFRLSPNGTLNALFSFANTNGSSPIAGLILADDGNFYGTTYAGGAFNAGTVFKIGVDGTFSSLYSFTGGADGSNCYAGLLLASDGNLYGATESGGTYGLGTLFRISQEGGLVTLANFDGYQGANPEGRLVQGDDGALYGTTLYGGAAGDGTIFRLSIDLPLQITRQPRSQTVFAGETVRLSVATFGSLPVFYQWQRSNTNLVDGGNISGANSRVLTLTNVSAEDAAPYSMVVSNAHGQVPSTTANLQVNVSRPQIVSGPNSQAVLAGGTATFTVRATGDAPLFFHWQQFGTNLADGGNISGSGTPTLTLKAVGAANAGTYSVLVSNAVDSVSSAGAVLTVLPVISPSASLATLHAFGSGTNASNPYGGLVQGTDTNFYGTAINGGAERFGAAFRLSRTGAFSVLHSFINGPDGANPYAGLVQAGDGNLYGATFNGVEALYGTLFRLAPNGTLTSLHSFTGGYDGAQPLASLVVGSDGQLYGTTSAGGTNDLGAVFSLSTNGVFTPLWSFSGIDGSYPNGPLIQGSDGQFYGTTSTGGTNGLGTVFRVATSGTLMPVVAFAYPQGAYPSNSLVQAADGAFYGTASRGGTNGGWGTVFRVTADGTLTALHSFNGLDGAYPVGGLLVATDGNLYGTTSQGGIGGQGTVFQITTSGVLTTLVWFNGPNGANPQSALIQARDGDFYGTTMFGGSEYDGAPGSGDGLVFRLILPMFLSQSLTQTVATVGQPYAASLSANSITPLGHSVTFAKVDGPAWLAVAANGALSGTPSLSDLGTNVFAVSLSDTNGWVSTATLRITVVPAPLVASLALNLATNLLLSWTGGQPPYQVQMATDLVHPLWQPIAGPLNTTTFLLATTNAAAFYRITTR